MVLWPAEFMLIILLPESLLTTVGERCHQCPVALWAYTIFTLCQCTDNPLSFQKIERAFLYREKGKRPMNVIFYLCFQLTNVETFVLDAYLETILAKKQVVLFVH